MPAISQQPRRLETGLLAKPDVDEDDIRPQRLDTLNRFGGVTGHPGYGHPVAVQQGTGDVEEVGIVIDYHAPDLHWTSLPLAHAVRIAASKEHIAPSRRPELSRCRSTGSSLAPGPGGVAQRQAHGADVIPAVAGFDGPAPVAAPARGRRAAGGA